MNYYGPAIGRQPVGQVAYVAGWRCKAIRELRMYWGKDGYLTRSVQALMNTGKLTEAIEHMQTYQGPPEQVDWYNQRILRRKCPKVSEGG